MLEPATRAHLSLFQISLLPERSTHGDKLVRPDVGVSGKAENVAAGGAKAAAESWCEPCTSNPPQLRGGRQGVTDAQAPYICIRM